MSTEAYTGLTDTTQVRCRDVQAFLGSIRGSWDYPEDTVDTFKAGDADEVVTGIAVSWMSHMWALRQAHELGCNLFITHEPTFYDHYDRPPVEAGVEEVAAKRRLIDELGITVLRCHDLWDRQPGQGITDRWALALGLRDPILSTEFTRVFTVEQTSARDFAARVASAVAKYGQDAVQLIGDPESQVERVTVGTGAITPFLETVMEHPTDLMVCSDDGVTYWRDGAYAIDHGPPIVVVNHAVTEEPGVASLAEVLRTAFPALEVHHISQTSMFRLIRGEGEETSLNTDGLSGGTRNETTKAQQRKERQL